MFIVPRRASRSCSVSSNPLLQLQGKTSNSVPRAQQYADEDDAQILNGIFYIFKFKLKTFNPNYTAPFILSGERGESFRKVEQHD